MDKKPETGKFTSNHNTLLDQLSENRGYVAAVAQRCRLTYQELRQLVEIARDLEMWGVCPMFDLYPLPRKSEVKDKQSKKKWLANLHTYWEKLKTDPNRYTNSTPPFSVEATAISREKEKLGLGYCPVASPKTRCCNLLTLDAVENCGYGCSYCSIQSFYSDNEVYFDARFGEKLRQLEIDPDQLYHIGTGQSSDSLMWGNSHNTLDALIEFANRHPNVILELKTKSANVNHLLRVDYPRNIICTWSLNTPTLISHEELGSAPLSERLAAARQIADKGHVVGFHFHPIIQYEQWREDYSAIFGQLQQIFHPDEVAMVSLGTLTYIKPVIKQIRERGGASQILKMPLVEADGKLSYPDEVKLDLFSHAYNSFTTEWQEKVFFYLCMENQRFWEPVFGYEYEDNDVFELAMKEHYMAKIRQHPVEA